MFKLKLLILFLFLLLIVLISATAYSLTEFNLFSSPERFSPSDWITEQEITVTSDQVIINVLNPTWAKFTDTNSMDPFIDERSNAIEVKPEFPEQIKIGDVVSYKTKYGSIIHRVIEINEDENGFYYRVQGDNNTLADPIKVIFENIEGVVVAVIY